MFAWKAGSNTYWGSQDASTWAAGSYPDASPHFCRSIIGQYKSHSDSNSSTLPSDDIQVSTLVHSDLVEVIFSLEVSLV